MRILLQNIRKVTLKIQSPVVQKLLPVLLFLIFAVVSSGYAQQKTVFGYVYAFKDLKLKNIQVSTTKSKNSVQTDSLGRFKITCEPKDKVEFVGNGFKKTVQKFDQEERKIIKVKMIFNGGEKNIIKAVENGHVSKKELENSILLYPDQNYEYYNYPDIFNAISKIYAGNDNITVRGNAVYVRSGNATFSRSPAIFILNGKLALDVSDILPRDIESIEIIPDGSSQYGPGAANGVVFITTNN
jgi:hypothetical protein